MEILDLRHLRSRDLAPLLEEQKNLWQKELQWDYSSSAALIKRYIDAQALPGYVVVESGGAVGYSFYVYENFKGLIGDVFASDSPESGIIETQLFQQTIDTLQATPGIRRIEAQLMNLRRPPAFDFPSGGRLQTFLRRFMLLRLKEALPPEPQEMPNIHVAPWDPRRILEAAQLITNGYRGHVDSAISEQYRSDAGAKRFLDNIIHYPGCGDFDAASSFLAFRKDTSRLCGIILSSVVGEGVSHITQVCVAPELRSAGIGRMLIRRVTQKLRESGYRAVTLTVTSSNSGAVRLYEQLRFSTLKEFSAMAWDAAGQEESGVLSRIGVLGSGAK